MNTNRKTKRPLVIGLTGSIGMGKSTAAKILGSFDLPVFCADTAVHALLAPGGKAVKPAARLFPGAAKDRGIDRKALGREAFASAAKLQRLEKILHPLVRRAEKEFINKAKKSKTPAVVLEIPLLFETGADKLCDVTLCVSAPRTVQKKRVLGRAGMTPARFRAILKRQMPDRTKRRRADFVVGTGKGYADTRRQLQRIVAVLLESKD